jgi:hypothetical protein
MLSFPCPVAFLHHNHTPAHCLAHRSCKLVQIGALVCKHSSGMRCYRWCFCCMGGPAKYHKQTEAPDRGWVWRPPYHLLEELDIVHIYV